MESSDFSTIVKSIFNDKFSELNSSLNKIVEVNTNEISSLNEKINELTPLVEICKKLSSNIENIERMVSNLLINSVERSSDLIQTGSNTFNDTNIKVFDSSSNTKKTNKAPKAPTFKAIINTIVELCLESFTSESSKAKKDREEFKSILINDLGIDEAIIKKIDNSRCKSDNDQDWLLKYIERLFKDIKGDETLRNEIVTILRSKGKLS